MADLASQIAELQNEFQHFADLHPWVCLAVPPLRGDYGAFHAGELFGPPVPQLDSPGVRLPKWQGSRPVLYRVNTMTDEAHRLLFSVLEGSHQIPPDVEQDIREWDQQNFRYGWI